MRRLPDAEAFSLVPDVIGFADFLEAGERVCETLSAGWRSHVPDRLETFPYPNGSKLRWASLVRCPDLVLLRAAGGQVAMRTDPLLSDRVYSGRLRTAGAAWSLEHGLQAYKRWELRALADIEAEPLAEAWKTDVADYYASIDHHVLLERLSGWRCPIPALRVVMTMLDEWTSAGLTGLPIGPEASAVLGTAFLMPLDTSIAQLGLSHYRYMDDVVVIGRGLSPDDLASVVDDTLAGLHLRRSDAKTSIYPPGFARDAVQDVVLGYIAGRGKGRRASSEKLVNLLESEADEAFANPKRVRFALSGLRNDGDGSAVGLLAGSDLLLNSDPKATCSYLRSYGMRNQDVRERLVSLAIRPRSDEFDALRLHALRVASQASWGRSEGRQLFSMAVDERERSALRAPTPGSPRREAPPGSLQWRWRLRTKSDIRA